jgi:predicted SAM-dependent methyltransferase
VPRWFQSVETLPDDPPFTRALFERLGLRGINCGCGRGLEPGWFNTDLVRIEERDGRESELNRLARVDGHLYFLRHDATEPYPVEDECFDWAYSEHFIEHVSRDDAIAWLTEVHRMLRPGGLVRITTPNLAIFVRAYTDPNDPFYEQNRQALARTRRFQGREVPDRRGWMVNDIFYGWRHRWIYDFEELKHALVAAGFEPATVVEREVGVSAVAEVAALDLPGRALQTIYVEARRSERSE